MSERVNNYECGVYDDGEVYIQTEPRQLEATGGKVYLTVIELRRLLALVERRHCQHRDDGRGRCIDCGEYLPSSEGSAWKPSTCPADEQEREDQARREDAREHWDDEFASWRRG
jgi:hypothetical protein